jgi:hypothetical protein
MEHGKSVLAGLLMIATRGPPELVDAEKFRAEVELN